MFFFCHTMAAYFLILHIISCEAVTRNSFLVLHNNRCSSHNSGSILEYSAAEIEHES